jgi:hypothetical protein
VSAKRARPWWHRVDAEATSIATIPDPIIDNATPEQRADLAGIWQERASSELRVGANFAALVSILIEAGAEESVLQIATDAVPDELHHSQIAAALAARYRGDAEQWPGPQPAPLPMFVPASGELRAALLVMAMCCINETLACPVLEAQMKLAKSPLTHAGYHSVLTDEVDHARMGWAHLTSKYVSSATRRDLGEWLPRIFESRFREIFESHPLPGAGCSEHGIMTRKERQEVLHAGLRDVVLPGLRHIGVDPSPGEAWVKKAFGAERPDLS